MAADWIKMRTDLYRDPKVCLMADLLIAKDSELARYVSQIMQRDMTVTRNVTRNAVVGALVSIWGIARQRGERVGDDLVMQNCSPSVLDDIADLSGIGEAMEYVGWVNVADEGIVFPDFFRTYNIEPDTKNAERQRRYREKKASGRNVTRDVTRNVTGDVTVTSRNGAREEKRREEKEDSKTPPPPATGEGPKTDDATAPPVSPPPPPTKRKVASADPNFDPLAVDLPFKSDRFREAWEAWVRHRVKIKKRMSLDAVRLFFHQFVSWGEERTIAAIEHSIMQGYQGVFENTNRQGGAANPSGYKSKVDRDNEIWIENAQSCLE